MRKYNTCINMFAAILLVVAFGGCKKIEEGYLSEGIRYQFPTVDVPRGVVTIANQNLIFPDGSTLPLKVKLLDIRSKTTGKTAPEWYKNYRSYRFTSPLTNADSTMELFNKKIEYGEFPPFEFVESGGYFRFTSGTKEIPLGEYTFDLEVSNVKGTKIIKDAATLVVKEPDPYKIDPECKTAGARDGTPATFTYFSNELRTVTVKKLAGDVNRVIFKWVDKNGKPFNPKTEIKRRFLADGSYLNDFDTFSIFGNTEYTDSTMAYNFGIPPYPFKPAAVNGKNSYLWVPSDYVILDQYPPAQYPKAALSIRYIVDIFVEGTWEITVKCLHATHK